MLRFTLPVFAGAALGAALGPFGSGTSHTCPRTSTWWRGARSGGFLGRLVAFNGRSV